VRRRSCGAGVLSIQQPFGRDQLVFAGARHTAPLALALGKQGSGEMRWIALLVICVALAFVPWRRVYLRIKPYALRVAIGVVLFATIVAVTFNIGALKLL